MKDNFLDVLVYLYENYLADATAGEILRQERDSLQAGLLDAGFDATDISRAFHWLDGIQASKPEAGQVKAPKAIRVFSPEETDVLDPDCRGFLLLLEQQGVLDSHTRELVLDRLYALDLESIDIDHVKWVVLMVLVNQPGQEAACAWVESHLFADEEAVLN